MLSRLKTSKKVIGTKQAVKAVRAGQAICVYIAMDADPMMTDPVRALCVQLGVRIAEVPSMDELGRACGVKSAAMAAILS